MKSSQLGKLGKIFSRFTLKSSEALPLDREAILVMAPISHIKPVKLSSSEMERAKSMTHKASRERYLAGRYLVRTILAGWFNIPSHDLRIELMTSGKPFLPDMPSLHFSLSHTGHLVTALFAHQPVGVDIEQERSLDTMTMARRFFSSDEAAFLEHSPEPSDFFRFWCAREAAIKADGRGMAQVLSETKILLAQKSPQDALTVWIERVAWVTYSWRFPDGIHGAVAFREPPDVIHWCDLEEAVV